MPIPLYDLVLEDNTIYLGGDLASPKWRESPDKAILSFKLKLPSGDFLLLEGYDAYNFFVEAVNVLSGAEKGKHLTYLYMMGLKDAVITSYRISLGTNAGDMTIRRFPEGKEYANKPTTGWHRGK